MKLVAQRRDAKNKSDIKKARNEGFIPAIIYASGKNCENIFVPKKDFKMALQTISSGHLPTTLFSLELDGVEKDVIIKEIQYHKTTYDVLHLDFAELQQSVPVVVKVPIICAGLMDCVGVKLGGFLRQVIRHVKVKCLPKQIPAEFTVDISSLAIGQFVRLSDLVVPEGVKIVANLREIVAVIAKK